MDGNDDTDIVIAIPDIDAIIKTIGDRGFVANNKSVVAATTAACANIPRIGSRPHVIVLLEEKQTLMFPVNISTYPIVIAHRTEPFQFTTCTTTATPNDSEAIYNRINIRKYSEIDNYTTWEAKITDERIVNCALFETCPTRIDYQKRINSVASLIDDYKIVYFENFTDSYLQIIQDVVDVYKSNARHSPASDTRM